MSDYDKERLERIRKDMNRPRCPACNSPLDVYGWGAENVQANCTYCSWGWSD